MRLYALCAGANENRNAHLEPKRLHLEIMAPPRPSPLRHASRRQSIDGLPTSRYGRHRGRDHWDIGSLVFVQAVLPRESLSSRCRIGLTRR